jgi:hypothetical protein
MAVNKPTFGDYLERKELGLRVLRLLQDAVDSGPRLVVGLQFHQDRIRLRSLRKVAGRT